MTESAKEKPAPQPAETACQTLSVILKDLAEAPGHPGTLAGQARGLDRLLGPTLLISGLLLVLGWVLPMMTVRKLVLLSEQVSILGGIGELWAAGHYLLFLILLAFSVVFPAVKILFALTLLYGADAAGPQLARALVWLEILGRWSMLDVFAVALIVIAIQISLISDVTTHAGLHVFTAAILGSLLAVQRLSALARRESARERSERGD